MRFEEVEKIINNVSSVTTDSGNIISSSLKSVLKRYQSKPVRLDATRIVNNEEYTHRPNTYKDFINTHWDDILHIEPLQYYKTFVTLAEDINNPKWLFDIEDLVEVNE